MSFPKPVSKSSLSASWTSEIVVAMTADLATRATD
jgi:hypothetical protein